MTKASVCSRPYRRREHAHLFHDAAHADDLATHRVTGTQKHIYAERGKMQFDFMVYDNDSMIRPPDFLGSASCTMDDLMRGYVAEAQMSSVGDGEEIDNARLQYDEGAGDLPATLVLKDKSKKNLPSTLHLRLSNRAPWHVKKQELKDPALHQDILRRRDAQARRAVHVTDTDANIHELKTRLVSLEAKMDSLLAAVTLSGDGLQKKNGVTVDNLAERAENAGVRPRDIDKARDSKDPKSDLLRLIATVGHSDIAVGDLREVAGNSGVPPEEVKKAAGGADPQGDLLAWITAAVEKLREEAGAAVDKAVQAGVSNFRVKAMKRNITAACNGKTPQVDIRKLIEEIERDVEKKEIHNGLGAMAKPSLDD